MLTTDTVSGRDRGINTRTGNLTLEGSDVSGDALGGLCC